MDQREISGGLLFGVGRVGDDGQALHFAVQRGDVAGSVYRLLREEHFGDANGVNVSGCPRAVGATFHRFADGYPARIAVQTCVGKDGDFEAAGLIPFTR